MTLNFIDHNTFAYRFFGYGRFGVQLFFIISGMVIPWSLHRNAYAIHNFGKFLLKRLVRLEPPYLFSILLVLGLIFGRAYWFNHEVTQEVSAGQVFLHLGYLVPFFKDVSWLNNVYWTLAIEFQYYLLIGLLYFLFVSPVVYLRLLGYAVLAAGPLLHIASSFLPSWLPLFAIGILLFQFKAKIINQIEFYLLALVFLVEIYLLNERFCTLIGLGAIFTILYGFNVSNKALAFLGKFSYSVYLIHPVLGATLINVLSHYVTGGIGRFLLVIGGIIITAVGSYLMYLLVEKPSRKLSSTFKYRNV